MDTFKEEMEVPGFSKPSSFLKDGYHREMDELVDPMLSSSAAAALNNTIQPYTFRDALLSADIYNCGFAILVYHPIDGKLILLYSKQHYWTNMCNK